MPKTNYIRVLIDGQQMDLEDPSTFPISIEYQMEDGEDFERKKSSESLNNTFPATANNNRIANSSYNVSVEDLTADQSYKSNKPVVVEANGLELMVGKAIQKAAVHRREPISYQFDFYGGNADWIIDLKEATLFDFLKHINFPFNKAGVVDSWSFDGKNPNKPYVFAPVRYGEPMASAYSNLVQQNPTEITDYNMKPEYMKPSLSMYYIIFNAFKSVGYKIQSDFFNTDYFRRLVMPWTWGNFLFSEGTRLDNLDFKAKSSESVYYSGSYTGIWDLKVSNDNSGGAFDNNGVYSYDSVQKECKWKYLENFDYGTLEATFRLSVMVDATVAYDSDAELRAQWFKNGVRITTGRAGENGNGDLICAISKSGVGRNDFANLVDVFGKFTVNPGDVISVKFYMHTYATRLGRANIRAEVIEFGLEFFKIPLGGTIDFQNYAGLKKHKFLDFFRGVIDLFNLSINTDAVNKVVVIEPTHPYSLTNDLSQSQGGYFNGDHIDWSEKQDISIDSVVETFSDHDREVIFRFAEDNNDGLLKVIQDRYLTDLASSKYVLPDRFKSGKKEIRNRFFSPVMHYDVDQWRGLGSNAAMAPQMICMVPENISNTSRDEAQNTFSPKVAYYKGIVSSVGWVFDSEKKNTYPFMFAVNYQPGGENDPVLSYSDERIGAYPNAVLAKGLLRRFYLQRMAIMRNGQYYTTNFRLNNIDVTNWFHREHIICRGQRWQLMKLMYKPLLDQSAECELRKWVPVSKQDADSVFPAASSVLETTNSTSSFDLKYAQMKCLASDIPQSSYTE